MIAPFTAAVRAVEPPASTYDQPDRIVAIAGILGEYELYVELLQNVALIDENLHWIGGRAHLVILGNLIGEGAGVMKALDLTRELEKEASEAGGMVHLLLGFTEYQLLHRNPSVVNPVIYENLATDHDDQGKREFVERGVQEILSRFPDAPHPERLRAEYENRSEMMLYPGSVQFLAQFAPGTELGDWLRSRNILIRIGDYLFSHSGLSLKFMDTPLAQLNDEMRASLAKESLALRLDIDQLDPIWWREIATEPETKMQRIVEEILAHTKARAQIIGLNNGQNIPTHAGVGARVYFVDSGMRDSQLESEDFRLSGLEIARETFTLLWGRDRIDAPAPGAIPVRKND